MLKSKQWSLVCMDVFHVNFHTTYQQCSLTPKLTDDIMGSITAATSFCFSKRCGMPISMVAAARSRTLDAEWTTKGMTNFTHRMVAPPICAGACSNSLKHKCYCIMVPYSVFHIFNNVL